MGCADGELVEEDEEEEGMERFGARGRERGKVVRAEAEGRADERRGVLSFFVCRPKRQQPSRKVRLGRRLRCELAPGGLNRGIYYRFF